MYRKINKPIPKYLDIIIIGGGHSGIEAVNISNKLKLKILLITEKIGEISNISCNPSIGGIGKDQLIKELTKLGGLMGKYAILTGTNFQKLNNKKSKDSSKRIQIDKFLYSNNIKHNIFKKNVLFKELKVKKLIKIKNHNNGVITEDNQKFFSKYLLICTGTFTNRKIYNGLNLINQNNENFTKIFKKHKNFKTGTPPRLIKNNINFKKIKTIKQTKNNPYKNTILNFKIKKKIIPFWKTKTNKDTQIIIKKYIKYSTRYSGLIKCNGPRYCPSIEDKICKYNKKKHTIFLEKESLVNNIIYPGGLSISLPNTIQNIIINSIKGLNKTSIIKYGFNVQYSYLDPKILTVFLEHKKEKNIFFSGQINGTSGYEEAAVQGLIAGINIYNKIKKTYKIKILKNNPFIRTLINNITKKNISEPYRIFKSKINNFNKTIKKNINNNFIIKNNILLLINNLSTEDKHKIQIHKTNKPFILIKKILFNNCLNKINTFINNIIKNNEYLL